MLNYWLYDQIYNKIRYFKSEKSGITKSIHHNFARIRINSYNSLRTEKILSFDNVIILIKLVVNNYNNHYYHNTFLVKGWYKDRSNTKYF